MNFIELDAKRNLPNTTELYKFMQDTYGQLEHIAKVLGGNYILSGCLVTGTAVSDGMVVLGGMVMPFVGGAIQEYVRIKETTTTETVSGGTRTEHVFNAEFGTITDVTRRFRWDSLNVLRPEKKVESIVLDIGAWNMLTTRQIIKSGILPLSFRSGVDILGIEVHIRRDDNYETMPLNFTLSEGRYAEGRFFLKVEGSSLDVVLTRFDDGHFHSSGHSGAGNRGHIILKYKHH